MTELLYSDNPEHVARVKHAITKWIAGKIMGITLSENKDIPDDKKENVETVIEILDKAFNRLEERCDDKLKGMIREARMIYTSDEMDFKSTHQPSNLSH